MRKSSLIMFRNRGPPLHLRQPLFINSLRSHESTPTHTTVNAILDPMKNTWRGANRALCKPPKNKPGRSLTLNKKIANTQSD